MISKVNKFFAKRKFAFIPAFFVFAFLANAGLNTIPRHALIVKAVDTPFILIDDKITVSLRLEAETPINVVGAVITYPTDVLEIISISTEDSLINLWAREPSFSNDLGLINFGGGIIAKGGYIGVGNVFTITLKPLKTGVAEIVLEGAVMLAQDNYGTNVLSTEINEKLYIRDAELPSPDVNNDGALTLSDIQSVYLHTFNEYQLKYDINGDGRVTLSDVSSIISIY